MAWYEASESTKKYYAAKTLHSLPSSMPQVNYGKKKVEEQIRKEVDLNTGTVKIQQMARYKESQAPADNQMSYAARTLKNLPSSMPGVKDGRKKVEEQIKKQVDVNKGEVKMQQMARYKAVEGKPNQGAKEVKEKITEYKNLKNGERKIERVVKKYY